MKTIKSIMESATDKHFLMLAASLGGIKAVFEQYVFSDWQFLAFLAVMIGADTLLGVYKAWKLKTIESKAFARLFEKVLLYMCVLTMTNVLGKFTISGVGTGLFDWLDNVLYCGIMVREAISIVENAAEINPTLLPSWLLRRLKKFDDSGKLKDLISEE